MSNLPKADVRVLDQTELEAALLQCAKPSSGHYAHIARTCSARPDVATGVFRKLFGDAGVWFVHAYTQMPEAEAWISLLTFLQAKYPDNPVLSVRLAGHLAEQGEYAQAISFLPKIIHDPKLAYDAQRLRLQYVTDSDDIEGMLSAFKIFHASFKRGDGTLRLYRRLMGLNPFLARLEGFFRAEILSRREDFFSIYAYVLHAKTYDDVALTLCLRYASKKEEHCRLILETLHKKGAHRAALQLLSISAHMPRAIVGGIVGEGRPTDIEPTPAERSAYLKYYGRPPVVPKSAPIPQPKISVQKKLEEERFAKIVSFFNAGRYKSALSLTAILEGKPDDPRIYLYCGAVRRKMGLLVQGRKDIQTAIEKAQGNPDILTEIGSVCGRIAETRIAIDSLNMARTADAWHLPSRQELAKIARQFNDILEEAILLEEMAEIAPEDDDIAYRRASVYKQTQTMGKAVNVLQELRRRNPNHLESRTILAKILFHASQNNTHRKTLEQHTLEIIEEILAIEATHAPANILKARILEERGAYSEAAQAYERATINKPWEVRAYCRAAECWMRMQDQHAAFAILEKGYKANPTNTVMLLAYGDHLMASGKNAEAFEVMKRDIQVRPDDKRLVAGVAHTWHSYGFQDDAYKLLTHAMAKHGWEKDMGRAVLGLLKYDREIDSACELAKDLHTRFPDDMGFRTTYGSLLLMAGDVETFEDLRLDVGAADPQSFLVAKHAYMLGKMEFAHRVVAKLITWERPEDIRPSPLALYILTGDADLNGALGKVKQRNPDVLAKAFQEVALIREHKNNIVHLEMERAQLPYGFEKRPRGYKFT